MAWEKAQEYPWRRLADRPDFFGLDDIWVKVSPLGVLVVH
jgi:hypothetical protein